MSPPLVASVLAALPSAAGTLSWSPCSSGRLVWHVCRFAGNGSGGAVLLSGTGEEPLKEPGRCLCSREDGVTALRGKKSP